MTKGKVITIAVIGLMLVTTNTYGTMITLFDNIDRPPANTRLRSQLPETSIQPKNFVGNVILSRQTTSCSSPQVTLISTYFHGSAIFDQNAAIQNIFETTSNLFSPSIGSTIISATQINNFRARLWLINILVNYQPVGKTRSLVSS